MHRKFSILILFCLLFLTGCSTINGFFNYGQPSPTIAITPDTLIPPTSTVSANATLASNEYRVISPEACSVAKINLIRTDSDQTGLVAWNANSQTLAYIAPRTDQNWYVGDVSIAKGKDFATQSTLTSDVQAVGDLVWSPGGDYIAFLAYRKADLVYTVMTVDMKGNSKDLFPGDDAKTDSYASVKKIMQWASDQQVDVQTTCGVDCEQEVDINVSDGTLTNAGNPVRKGTLIPAEEATQARAYDTTLFPKMTELAWSPNGKQVAFVDEDGTAWLLTQAKHTQSVLNVNGDTIEEMKWSPDGKWIAVHVDGAVTVFKLGCGQ